MSLVCKCDRCGAVFGRPREVGILKMGHVERGGGRWTADRRELDLCENCLRDLERWVGRGKAIRKGEGE